MKGCWFGIAERQTSLHRIVKAFPVPLLFPSTVKRWIVGVGLSVFVLVWLWFVWPTPWQYYRQNDFNYRVNRFTGETQYFTPTGWHRTPLQ